MSMSSNHEQLLVYARNTSIAEGKAKTVFSITSVKPILDTYDPIFRTFSAKINFILQPFLGHMKAYITGPRGGNRHEIDQYEGT